MMEFLNIPEILDFFVANLGLLEKSMISGRIPGFLGYLSFLDIPEMMDFTNISEILDFLVTNLGILDISMISRRIPHAKHVENRNFSPIFFSRDRKNCFGGKFLGEKFLGTNVSGGGAKVSVVSRFPRFVRMSGFLG